MFLCFGNFDSHAQLGFCSGNSGDPIITENFGTGSTNTTLPIGTTTYAFTNGFPNDGFYTVSNGTFGNSYDWHQIEDHTPNDVDGKCLIINAGFTAGEFYRTTVSGLCETTTYEFSAWLINLVIAGSFCSTQPSGSIPINVRFEIWDSTDSNLLASGNTGNIFETSTPNWEEYGLVFQTIAGQNTVILKMINNGQGGCGNDLAIDDIEFKSCGDTITLSDLSNNNSVSLCSGETPFDTTVTAVPDNTVFSSHFYQWQESNDNSNWTDIAGATNQDLNITGIITTTYYRAKVAEFAANLSNEDCITLSDTFEIIVNQAPDPPTLECWETATLNNATCNWDISGTQPMEPTGLECWQMATFNNSTCSWEVTGTQPEEPTDLECWETTTFNEMTCSWEITGTQPIELIEEFLQFCEGEEIALQASTDISNATFNWSTGETTELIIVNSSGTYTAETTDGCVTIVKTIYLEQQDIPMIESVLSDGNDLIVNTANSGDFLYSLDGINFQISNVFVNIAGGKYTVYIRAINCDEVVTVDHLHFYIPKFFTPNGDSFHDTFDLKGIECYESSEVFIFDRYGKLLYSAKNTQVAWDGTFINEILPSTDYWYLIKIDGQEFRGHFTLKR